MSNNVGLFIAILLLPIAIRGYAALIAGIRWAALKALPDNALRRIILFEFKGKAVAVVCAGILLAYGWLIFIVPSY